MPRYNRVQHYSLGRPYFDIPLVMYNYYFYPEEGTHTSGSGIDYTITYT